MSAWIESHQTLRNHPKTRRLARNVGSLAAAIGHLHCLWWWCMDYAPDGDLSRFDDSDVADGSEWDGDPAIFMSALMDAGFVTEERCVHDWHDYAGRLIEKREANALRNRQWRARNKPAGCTSTSRDALATRTQRGPNALPNRTEPNNRSRALADADAPAGVDNSPTTVDNSPSPSESDTDGGDFAEWWTAYGKVGSKADAERLYRFWRSKGAERADLLAAAQVYRAHCERTDCKMQHARTFLAKPQKGSRARWYEWAEGEEHGGMDVGASRNLSDVLTAGAEAFGLTGGTGDNGSGTALGQRRSTRAAGRGQDARRSLPTGELEG